MAFLWIKSLHIIFIVTWFAGLFYIVRLFIYQIEAQERPLTEKNILSAQFKIMSRKLWYMITWPSAVLTLIFGGTLLCILPAYISEGWMIIKLTFVLLLYVYHFSCHRIFLQLQEDRYKYSSTQLRIWNEVATILLFAIVFLVVFKTATDWIWGTMGLVLFAGSLMIAIRIYKNIRSKKN